MGAQSHLPRLQGPALRKPSLVFELVLFASYFPCLNPQPTGYKVTASFWAANIVSMILIMIYVKRSKRSQEIADAVSEDDRRSGEGDERGSVEDVKVAA